MVQILAERLIMYELLQGAGKLVLNPENSRKERCPMYSIQYATFVYRALETEIALLFPTQVTRGKCSRQVVYEVTVLMYLYCRNGEMWRKIDHKAQTGSICDDN